MHISGFINQKNCKLTNLIYLYNGYNNWQGQFFLMRVITKVNNLHECTLLTIYYTNVCTLYNMLCNICIYTYISLMAIIICG